MKKTICFFMLILSFTYITVAQTPGNSLHFDGTDDQVNSLLPAVFNNITANNFTIEAWVYPQASVFSRLVYAQFDASNAASLSFSASNIIYFYVVKAGVQYSLMTTSALPVNQWSHVAGRWTASTSTTEVFINGILQSGSSGGTTSFGTGTMMTLGSKPGGAQFFTGQLDEVRIWNSARTSCQIYANRYSSLTGTEPNLVCYYKFDSGIAAGTNTGITTLTDAVGSYNGTLVNFALTGSTSNWLASNANINSMGTGTDQIIIGSQATICRGSSYTFPDGFTQPNITSQFVHYSNFQTPGTLCDSIIMTTVNIDTVDVSVVQNETILTANATGTYQWLNCNNAYAEINGATNKVFNAPSNGMFAVEITVGGCIDTSACYTVYTFGLDENNFGNNLSVYPNPGKGSYSVDLGSEYQDVSIMLTDTKGSIIEKRHLEKCSKFVLNIEGSQGIYFLAIVAGNKMTHIKIIKE